MDSLGDRMKSYEARECDRLFMPHLPIYARIDGRCFSSFTAGMDRPYDKQMADCMTETCRLLVHETHALAGYTQSDEISLLWHGEHMDEQMLFGGKVFKLTSVLASLATSAFTRAALPIWPYRFNGRLVSFDCRVFQLPNKVEASNAFLWRELDATKNAVSMAARAICGHKELHEKNGAEMQELMFSRGVNFNDYPSRFKRGQFVIRHKVYKELDAETLARIPEDKRPTGPIERRIIESVDMPKFSTVTNRVHVLFDGAEPIVENSPPSDKTPTPQ